jgi:hypothetical protein
LQAGRGRRRNPRRSVHTQFTSHTKVSPPTTKTSALGAQICHTQPCSSSRSSSKAEWWKNFSLPGWK